MWANYYNSLCSLQNDITDADKLANKYVCTDSKAGQPEPTEKQKDPRDSLLHSQD